MSTGASVESVLSAAILSTVSIPDVTFPKTVYFPSRNFESFNTMKNWEPALSGSCDLAIDNTPRECVFLLNSALTFQPGPPVPIYLCWMYPLYRDLPLESQSPVLFYEIPIHHKTPSLPIS